jgi:hypothetical protein
MDTLICAESRHFPNDKTGRCSVCFVPLYFRPHSEKYSRRVCLSCGMKEIKKSGQVPVVTEESKRELKSLGVPGF